MLQNIYILLIPVLQDLRQLFCRFFGHKILVESPKEVDLDIQTSLTVPEGKSILYGLAGDWWKSELQESKLHLCTRCGYWDIKFDTV